MKVVFPVLWIGGFSTATFVLFTGAVAFTDAAGNRPPNDMKWTVLFMTLAGAGFIYWSCIRLKRVELDEHALYISNYQTEVVVPLRDVDEVTENRWLNIHPVTVHFFGDTAFGTSITFMPKVRWFAFFSSHPIVAELRAAVARARGAAPDMPAA